MTFSPMRTLCQLIPAFALALIAFEAQADEANTALLKCATGPVQRQYGGTDWLVYSCDDQRTMVVVSAEGNPASPFYFLLAPKSGSYVIHGEGNGDKAASEAAWKELSQMPQSALADLLQATKTGTDQRHR